MHVVLPMLLELFKDVTVQVQQGEGARTVSTVPLLSQLTMQRDIDGRTPLHLAASSDARPWNGLLRRLFPRQIWSWSGWHATKVLLDANVSTAYQADNQGSYAVHAAAS